MVRYMFVFCFVLFFSYCPWEKNGQLRTVENSSAVRTVHAPAPPSPPLPPTSCTTLIQCADLLLREWSHDRYLFSPTLTLLHSDPCTGVLLRSVTISVATDFNLNLYFYFLFCTKESRCSEISSGSSPLKNFLWKRRAKNPVFKWIPRLMSENDRVLKSWKPQHSRCDPDRLISLGGVLGYKTGWKVTNKL